MTDYTDLIARLRKYSKQLLPCTHEAADALEAQAKYIAKLSAQITMADNHLEEGDILKARRVLMGEE